MFEHTRVWGPHPSYPLVENYMPPKDEFIVLSGPCSVESEEQISKIAHVVAFSGATHLRGGVFRAGTYPGKSFGLIEEKLIQAFSYAARKNGLKTVIEVLDYRADAMDVITSHADCFQVGCRSMQNYTLLHKLGETGKTIFLKRHPGSTLDEWLGSAEHLLTAGRCHPVLVERGSSSFLNHVRWDLSISIIPAIKRLTGIPIIVDASHGTGRHDLVESMTLAGVAAGADGLLVECHPDPKKSLSDASQAISLDDYIKLMTKVNIIRKHLFNARGPNEVSHMSYG